MKFADMASALRFLGAGNASAADLSRVRGEGSRSPSNPGSAALRLVGMPPRPRLLSVHTHTHTHPPRVVKETKHKRVVCLADEHHAAAAAAAAAAG